MAFLSCGSALQPILPKSQCWCVDEASSKFVLQIRRPQYWRIEVPVTDSEDVRRALLLRDILDKVLRFEKTECPFKRAFTVDLPAPPPTPVKKRPWTPVRSIVPSFPPTPVTPAHPDPPSRRTPGRIQKPECFEFVADEDKDKEGAEREQTQKIRSNLSDVETNALGEEAASIREPRADDVAVASEAVEGFAIDDSSRSSIANEKPLSINPAPSQPRRATGFQASRSGTAPPQLALPPGGPGFQVEVSEPVSPVGSQDSFHSVGSWSPPHTPLPPSPPASSIGSPKALPYAQDDLHVEKRRPRLRKVGLTASTENINLLRTSTADDETRPATAVSEPEKPLAATSLSPSANSTPSHDHRSLSSNHRPTTSSSISPSRRVLFPLPSAINLFSPRQPFLSTGSGSGSGSISSIGSYYRAGNRLDLVRRLPMAVVHKTVEILFSPPVHLITLMLRVAARITAGEWRGYVFGTGESGETIPVRWDWSDEDDDGEGELGGWGADEDWPCASPDEMRRLATTATTTTTTSPPEAGLKMAGSFPESPSDDEGEPLGCVRAATAEESPSGRKVGKDRPLTEFEGYSSDGRTKGSTESLGQSWEVD